MKDFVDFKVLLAEAAYGELDLSKKFDPRNPQVHVHGVGMFKLDQLKERVAKQLEDIAQWAKASEFDKVLEQLSPKSIVNHYVNAIVEVEKQLSSPNIKRKVTLMNKVKEAKKAQAAKELGEATPPDAEIEKWVLANKRKFISQYGKEKGMEVLYRTAWSNYNKKHGKK